MFEWIRGHAVAPNSIERLMTIGGWTEPGQLRYLMQQVRALPDASLIVEVGVWQGRSAIAMAEACRGTRKRVVAIDPWRDYDTAQGPLSSRLPEFGVSSIESVYDTFLANRRRFGVEPWLETIRATSSEAAAGWSRGPCAMVFIDGDHSYGAVRADLNAWSERTASGGLVCGDDWGRDTVRRAVMDMVEERGLPDPQVPCPNTWAVTLQEAGGQARVGPNGDRECTS